MGHAAVAGWRTIACIAALLAAAGGASADTIKAARFVGPTTHYNHGILGDAVEWSGMSVTLSDGKRFLIGFSEGGHVFEDTEPRLWDVTGDGAPEIVVIETDPPRGAQLAIYGARNGGVEKIAATPFIGRTHRWLAPVGAADLDGDGRIEIAYVDRPHLAKVLRLWRFEGGRLRHLGDLEGLTNHKIGWDFIAGGIRNCGEGPEMITADAAWARIMATRFDGKTIRARSVGPFSGPESFRPAMECRM